MSQTARSLYYQALKQAGVELTKPYREYSTAELQALHAERGLRPIALPAPKQDVPAAPPADDSADIRAQLAALTRVVEQLAATQAPVYAGPPQAAAAAPPPQPVVQRGHVPEPDRGLDPSQHAGLNSNTHGANDPLFTDEYGNEWYQREVTKPGYAKPRGRRVLRTYDAGTKVQTVKVDDTYTESFEVSDDVRSSVATEIKVTLPSYQCGIYKPKNMPFKIHTYNGQQGFDRGDVQAFFGGKSLVPSTIKDHYVHMDWCYNIQSVIDAINAEYRERVLGTTVNQRGL